MYKTVHDFHPLLLVKREITQCISCAVFSVILITRNETWPILNLIGNLTSAWEWDFAHSGYIFIVSISFKSLSFTCKCFRAYLCLHSSLQKLHFRGPLLLGITSSVSHLHFFPFIVPYLWNCNWFNWLPSSLKIANTLRPLFEWIHTAVICSNF